MRLSKDETLEAISTFLEHVVDGKTIDEISDEMGYDVAELAFLHKRLLEMKTDELQAKPVEHIYVEYLIEQLKNVNDLTKLIKNFDGNSRSLGAVVGAIRLKSDIHDRILEKGQECGVIRKVAERKENLHGLFIADLTADDLRGAIVNQYKKLAGMTKTIDGKSISELPIPRNLHYGESIVLPIDKEDKEGEEQTDDEYIKPVKKAKKKKKKKKKRKNEDD